MSIESSSLGLGVIGLGPGQGGGQRGDREDPEHPGQGRGGADRADPGLAQLADPGERHRRAPVAAQVERDPADQQGAGAEDERPPVLPLDGVALARVVEVVVDRLADQDAGDRGQEPGRDARGPAYARAASSSALGRWRPPGVVA